MTFTPSSTSSFTAGAVFWSMVWAGLGKLNELARFVGFKRVQAEGISLAVDKLSQSHHPHRHRGRELLGPRDQ